MSTATIFLVVGLLVTGATNTVLNKLQDMACVANCSDPNPHKRHYYEQPLWQTLNMFCGEACCLLVFFLMYLYERRKSRADAASAEQSAAGASSARSPLTPAAGTGRGVTYGATSPLLPTAADNDNIDGVDVHVPVKDLGPGPITQPQALSGSKVLLLWLPTLCDLCATTLMNVGLIYTSASIYQMLRGAVVLFTGTFSVIFLRRRLLAFQWLALVLVVCGVGIVGASSILFPDTASKTSEAIGEIEIATEEGGGSVKSAAVGVFMVLFAQVFTATQFVIEERVMERYDVVPLLAVGLEGIFGVISVLLAMPITYLIYGNTHPNGYFDIPTGWHQFVDNEAVWVPGIMIALSIAFFNWFGLSVTRSISATARSTLDTCRTIIIWAVSMSLGWESFRWLQVLGFGVLIYGTFVFNGVVRPPLFAPEPSVEDEADPLLREEQTHEQ